LLSLVLIYQFLSTASIFSFTSLTKSLYSSKKVFFDLASPTIIDNSVYMSSIFIPGISGILGSANSFADFSPI